MWVYMFHRIIAKNFQSFGEWRWNGQISETIRGSHRNLAWYRRSFPSIDSQLEMFLTTNYGIYTLILLQWLKYQGMLWWALPAPEWMMLWCYVDVHLYLHHFGTFRNQSYDLIWKSDVNDSPPIGHWHFTCCSPVWRLSLWCNKHCKPMGQRPLLKLERWDWLAGCLNESRARNNNCKVQEMESQKVAGADW